MRKKALALITDKTSTKYLSPIITIRGDATKKQFKNNPFDSLEEIEKILPTRGCSLVVSAYHSSSKPYLMMARSFNNEIIDSIEFEILNFSGFASIGPELCVKYFICLQNLTNKRLCNLLVDFFNMRAVEVNLDAIKYCWSVCEIENCIFMKYVRINKGKVEECGPSYRLKVSRIYSCSEELYEKACGPILKKKEKNVSKNVFNDRIGTVHMERQDLRDLRLRKRHIKTAVEK
ncbi:Ribosome production factor 2 like protein [Astathelohania contejeani]|uniref:Ribosome production factor 2 homolog n=1 Tax=Astathelohania contejeani TaxID=164912 RepID=A0ABQ7HY69_9MICR|nr:Ribosome production factor 2 like protein [Thelohania contejeani]